MTGQQPPTREQIDTAVGSVLFNVSNYPDAAQSRLWGRDLGQLREKVTDAVRALFSQPTPMQECGVCGRRYPAADTRSTCPVCWPGFGEHGQQPTPSAEPADGPTVIDLARRHCETFTGDSTCADDPDRSADSPYGATGYCYPCLIRNALSQPTRVVEPCCARPGDPNWHTADGGHVVPPDIEEDTPAAEPVSIADMAPGTRFVEAVPWTVVDADAVHDQGAGLRYRGLGTFDPSTIRDVTPPPTPPEEADG
jgi:hypothetical protein